MATEETPSPPSTAVAVGRFARSDPRFGGYRAHGAPGTVVLHTIAGVGRVRVGQDRAIAERGRTVLLGADVRHSYHVDPRTRWWDTWWAHFPLQPAWERWLEPYRTGRHLWTLEPVAELLPRLDALWQETYLDVGDPPLTSEASPPIDPAAFMHADATTWLRRQLGLNGLERILLLHRVADQPAEPGDPRIVAAQEAIAADPTVDLDTLARQAALSPSRFAHLFTELTGSSPHRAITEARMRLARQLLETSTLPITEVARTCGYPDAEYFRRVFRRFHAVPPRTYRSVLRHELGAGASAG